jgi:Bacteriocin-protection, YdeI or OmpD-Associated
MAGPAHRDGAPRGLRYHEAVEQANFARFPPSSGQLILAWIASAKRPATRQRRIQQTLTLAAHDIRANHPRTHAATPPQIQAPPAIGPFAPLDTDNPGSAWCQAATLTIRSPSRSAYRAPCAI